MARISSAVFLLVPLAVLPLSYDPYLIKVLFAAALITSALFLSLRRREKYFPRGVSVQLAVFALIMCVSVSGSSDPAVAALKLSKILTVFLLYFLLDEKTRETALNLLFISVTAVSVFAILQELHFLYSGNGGPFAGRAFSTLGNPNFLSSYLIISFPLYLMTAEKKGVSYLALLPWAGLLLSRTAGSILSLAVILVMLAAHFKKSRFLKILAAVHILLLAGALLFINISGKKQSVKERFFKWRVGFEMLKEKPLLGFGPGGVKTNFALFQPYVKRDFSLPSTSESKVHNDYIQIFAENGIAGGAAYLWLLISAALLLYRKNFYAFAALAAYMLDSISNFPMSLPSSLSVFVLILSFSGGAACKNTFKRLPVTAAAGAISLLCLFFISKDFAADTYRLKGKYFYDAERWDLAIPALEKARRISPTSGKILYYLGMADIKKKNYPAAIRAFEESIKIRHYGEIYNDLGNAFYLNDENDKAVGAWKKAVELGITGKEAALKNIRLIENKS